MSYKRKFVTACLLLVVAFLGSGCGTAFAAKVEAKTSNGRIMPAPALIVGTYDEQGRPDISIIDRAGVAAAVGGRKKVYVYVSSAPSRQTHKNIAATGAFTINMPSDAHIAQVDFCGSVSAISGDQYIDKFAITGLTPRKSDLVNAPMVAEFPISMECKVVKTKTFGEGSHSMYIAEVVRVWIDEGVMNGAGEKNPEYPNPQKVRSIVYYPGTGTGYGYYKVGSMVGKPENLYSKYPDGLK